MLARELARQAVRRGGAVLGVIAALLPWQLARGDIDILARGPLSFSVGIETGLFHAATENTNFGAGRFDARTGEETGDAQWSEGYAKPWGKGKYDLDGAGNLYGGLAWAGSFTSGDGDAGGFTDGGDGLVSIENAYLGWSSGKIFEDGLGEDALQLSYGRQDFHVADGFLIEDGNYDQRNKGAYWLAPRTAFRRAGLVQLNGTPWRGDGFFLKGDRDQENTELAGLNLEYAREGVGTFGAMYFHVLDSAGVPRYWGTRDGMDVYDVRVNGLTLPALPQLSFWGEYVKEGGSGSDASFDARGWYAELQYSLSELPWSPTLSYRYASFSGDGDPEDRHRKDFDPFFYGSSRGWGTWYQGEITGEYLLFNSNELSHTLHLTASPSESLSLGAIYYRFDLDQRNYYGTPVQDRHFADELDLYLDWTLNDYASVSASYAVAFPGDAAKQAFGDDKTFQLFEVALYVWF